MSLSTLVIVDYGSGNLRSAAKAFERAVREADLELAVVVSDDPGIVSGADRIVLPGVGAFADCMRGLCGVSGMVDALECAVLHDRKPFLGICVGMQLLATVGREHGDHDGLGWVPGEVVALAPSDPHLKIPHMGWNTLAIDRPDHPVLTGLEDGSHVYFVHSYQFHAENPEHVLAHTDYGGDVTAVIGRDNIMGTQFHPEKSQKAGLQFIRNFLTWKP